MALARNLQKPKKRFKLPKIKKSFLIIILAVALGIGGYGIYNLIRVAPTSSNKQELKLDTGDKPLPQKTILYVTADDGLFMRENPEPKAKILILIPNGTKLEALETQSEWYKVTYMDKTGWVNKNYVTTQAPAEDPTKNWKVFINNNFGYSVRYPTEWVAQDYGVNPATSSTSYVAFGPQLGPTLDPTKLPPVIVRVSEQTKEKAEQPFKTATNSISEPATVSGLPATKFVYNSASGVQMTAYVIQKSAVIIILEETGGFADELGKIMASMSLG